MEKERDYKSDCEILEKRIKETEEHIEELNNIISELQQYYNKAITELSNLKEENLILMRKVIYYSEKEIERMSKKEIHE